MGVLSQIKFLCNKNKIKYDSFIQNNVEVYKKYEDDKNQNIFVNKKN